MTRRPARIHSVIESSLARPRDPADADFQGLKDRIFSILGVERRV